MTIINCFRMNKAVTESRRHWALLDNNVEFSNDAIFTSAIYESGRATLTSNKIIMLITSYRDKMQILRKRDRVIRLIKRRKLSRIAATPKATWPLRKLVAKHICKLLFNSMSFSMSTHNMTSHMLEASFFAITIIVFHFDELRIIFFA